MIEGRSGRAAVRVAAGSTLLAAVAGVVDLWASAEAQRSEGALGG